MNPIWKRLSVFGALAAMASALCACAPASQMPPPVPLAKGQVIYGGTGTVGVANLRYKTDSGLRTYPFGVVQAWGGAPLKNGLIVHGSVFRSPHMGTGGGAGLRAELKETEWGQVGVQASVGWAYVSVGLPASVEVSAPLTLYTHPTVSTVTDDWMGVAFPLAVHLPIGLWWWSPRGTGLGVELGAQGFMTHMGALGDQPDLLAYLSISLGSSTLLTPDSAAR